MTQRLQRPTNDCFSKRSIGCSNKREYNAAVRFGSPNYIQHTVHIPPGREALFELIRSVPAALRYKAVLILANDESGIVHGKFSGTGQPRNWIAADIVRIAEGSS